LGDLVLTFAGLAMVFATYQWLTVVPVTWEPHPFRMIERRVPVGGIYEFTTVAHNRLGRSVVVSGNGVLVSNNGIHRVVEVFGPGNRTHESGDFDIHAVIRLPEEAGPGWWRHTGNAAVTWRPIGWIPWEVSRTIRLTTELFEVVDAQE
jgi:hypothetical protein|tara:strand:- start:4708 stop:5154 length:447 start_codon:yes stop_codon:yes gene_type:complete